MDLSQLSSSLFLAGMRSEDLYFQAHWFNVDIYFGQTFWDYHDTTTWHRLYNYFWMFLIHFGILHTYNFIVCWLMYGFQDLSGEAPAVQRQPATKVARPSTDGTDLPGDERDREYGTGLPLHTAFCSKARISGCGTGIGKIGLCWDPQNGTGPRQLEIILTGMVPVLIEHQCALPTMANKKTCSVLSLQQYHDKTQWW